MAKIDITLECRYVSVSTGNQYVKVQVEDTDPEDVLDAINGDDIAKYVSDNHLPQDIFPTEKLEEWAEQNGYTKA